MKGHINYIIPRLNSACYCMRTVKPYVLHNTLKMIYYSYFHSVMSYGLIFWGSSTESIKIFRLQKRIIRIMMGYKRNQSCRELFHKLGILSLPSQYIFSILIQGGSNMTGTDLCVIQIQSVPVIFEPPCIYRVFHNFRA